MSEQTPRDRELEALLDREGEMSRAWRGASRDEPSSALDDAIRADARRAVQAGPRPLPFGVRWRVPLSIAAVLVLSATLTVLVADRRDHVPSAGVSEAPAPAAKPAADAAARQSESKGLTLDPGGQAGESSTSGAAVAPAPTGAKREAQPRPLAKTRAEEEASVSAPAAVQRTDGTAGVEAGPGPMPEPRQRAGPEAKVLGDSAPLEQSNTPTPQLSAAAPAAPEAAATPASPPDSRVGRASPAPPEAISAQGAGGEGAVAKVDSESDAVQSREREAPVRAAMKAQDFAQLDAPTWIERILALRRQGKLKEAQQSFEAFRRRYPDYPLPPELAPAVVPAPR